jgi:hypothetical protein
VALRETDNPALSDEAAEKRIKAMIAAQRRYLDKTV